MVMELEEAAMSIVGGLDIAKLFATGLEKFVPIFGGLLERLQNTNQA